MKFTPKTRKPISRTPSKIDIPRDVLEATKKDAPELQILASTWLSESFSPVERSNAFLGLASELKDPQFWQLFHASWTNFEAIDDILFEEELGKRRDGWEKSYLKPEDQKFYDSLSHEVTIYRGQDCDDLVGLDWTTDRDMATSFAKSNHDVTNARPFLIQGLIAKIDIAGAYISRGRGEIVIFDFSKDIDIVESGLITP